MNMRNIAWCIALVAVVMVIAADGPEEEKVECILTVQSSSPQELVMPALGVKCVYKVKDTDLYYVIISQRNAMEQIKKEIQKSAIILSQQDVELIKPSKESVR